MSDPLVPNFNSTTGRLATDRFTFQNHVDGYNLRHKSNQIDLLSPITVDSVNYSDVQSALTALAAAVAPEVIPDATTTIKGILKLSGDLNGAGTTSNAPKVSGLQGRPISTLGPSSGQILTWSGSSWSPADPSNTFTASGDLDGNNISQQVINISGDSGTVTVSADTMRFVLNANPNLTQLTRSSSNGINFTIKAQSTTAASAKGGDLILAGGAAGSGGLDGGVKLLLDDHVMMQVVEPVLNQRVLGLVSNTSVTSTQMPANTGDYVVFIANANTIPSSGNPVGGAILYADDGVLYVKQADGDSFNVNPMPNPNIWGPFGQQIYTKKAKVNTNAGVASVLLSVDFSQVEFIDSIVKMNVLIMGTNSDNIIVLNKSAIYNVFADGTSLTATDSEIDTEPLYMLSAPGWAVENGHAKPEIQFTGASGIGPNDKIFTIMTGYRSANVTQWFAVVKFTILKYT